MSDLWSKAFRALRLPNGDTTEDFDAYAREWNGLIEFLELVFPGYKVFGYDPGFTLSHPDVKSGSLNINTHAAIALRDTVKALTPPPKKGAKR